MSGTYHFSSIPTSLPMSLVMMTRFIGLLAFAYIFAAHAQSVESLLQRDKDQCSGVASQKYTWIFHMPLWRESYNECLRQKLKALSPRYIKTTLEVQRLEDNCPEILMKGSLTEFSMTGFEIANHLMPKELQKDMTSMNLEETLKLYYQRMTDSQKRMHEFRH
jgi:hypothetical protein